MYGARIGSMRVNGKTIKCMAMAKQNGPMEESMRDNTTMTKSMESEHSTGQMVADTMELGKMESNTEEDSTS